MKIASITFDNGSTHEVALFSGCDHLTEKELIEALEPKFKMGISCINLREVEEDDNCALLPIGGIFEDIPAKFDLSKFLNKEFPKYHPLQYVVENHVLFKKKSDIKKLNQNKRGR